MAQGPIIDIQELQVRYGATLAVDGLSLQVMPGEIFGMLGPNGAGKTSTLACIEGLRRPDGGRVLVGGRDVAREPAAVKAALGVQLQKAALFVELSALELVELYAALYDRFPSRREAVALLERFGLGEKAGERPGRPWPL
jgi:ABC-2 type transport system ATP-binding protein